MSKSRPRKRPATGGGARRDDAAGARAMPAREVGGHADRAAVAVLVTLAALAVARAVFTIVPGTWLWPLAVQRFLPPWLAWPTWLFMVAALAPAIGRRAVPILGAWGDAIARRPAAATMAWMIAAVLLVALTPDQVRFVGDFLLRQGTVEVVEQPGVLFPQALPLDVFLHYTMPLAITGAHVLDANGASRVLGAVEAALLATCAVAFARALALRGVAACACASIVLFGGYLGMFTGFSKAFAEMCVLVALAGLSAVRVLRTGRGLLPLGVATAIAIALHRSALGLLPGVAFVWAMWWRRDGHTGAWKRADAWLGVALPLATLAVMGPRIVATVIGTDAAVHFAPEDVRLQGGMLRAALAGTRALDLVSLVLLLSPLAIAIPATLALARPPQGRVGELAALVLLAAPFLFVMPFLHPAQGLFRDWDDFAATGVALSLIAAWLVGETLERSPRFAWLGLAIVLGVALPALQWLLVHVDSVRGLERVQAFVTEPPTRTPAERGTTWDYLGIRNYRLHRYGAADSAFAHAAETSPSPRILQEWAVSATMADDLLTAQRAYHRLLERAPDNSYGWLGLAAVSMRLRDVPEAKAAAIGLLRLVPDSPEGRRILEDIAHYEALQADSLRRVAATAPRR